jgi:hypothetical protein
MEEKLNNVENDWHMLYGIAVKPEASRKRAKNLNHCKYS